MADLNQIELQHLRHLIGAHETAYQKLNTFSSQAVDPQLVMKMYLIFDMLFHVLLLNVLNVVIQFDLNLPFLSSLS